MMKYVKQFIKMIMQSVILPIVYRMYLHYPVDYRKIVIADAHSHVLPYSLCKIKEQLEQNGYEIEVVLTNNQRDGWLTTLKNMFSFMKRYAQARYVIICDNFLPVVSCKKREETKVIQLWHAAGALKKFGYDTDEDIPSYYRGNVYKNYDMVTVSSEACIPYFESAMRLPREVFVSTGISRMDFLFDEAYKEKIRERFYLNYPESAGKRIVLWTPTFRGSIQSPETIGLKEICQLETILGNEYLVIKKLHPHARHGEEQMPDFSSEELLIVADILITDYSSIIFDYMILGKPIIKFVPDLEKYQENRGFYISYDDLPGIKVQNVDELIQAVKNLPFGNKQDEIQLCIEKYLNMCDGHATDRIIDRLNNWR